MSINPTNCFRVTQSESRNFPRTIKAPRTTSDCAGQFDKTLKFNRFQSSTAQSNFVRPEISSQKKMNVLPQNQLLISNDKDFVEPVFHDGAQSRQIANPSDRHFFGRANIRCRLPLPSTAVRRPPHLLAPSLRILRCRIAHSVQPTVFLVRQPLPVAFGQFHQQPDVQTRAFFHSSFSFCPTFLVHLSHPDSG